MLTRNMVYPFMPFSQNIKQPVCPGGGGGGVYTFLSPYVGSGPAYTVHQKKISGISSTPIFFKYPNFFLKF